MHQALAVVALLVAVSVLARTVQRARAGSGGGRKPAAKRKDGFLASRRRLREMREKHRLDSVREQARHERRLAEQEARAEREREREQQRQPYGDGDPQPRRNGMHRTIRLRPEAPDGGDSPRDDPQPRRRTDDGGAGNAPPPPPPSEGTTTVTTPAIRTGIEDLVTAIDRIRATAMAGNAKAKLAALRACVVACTRFAGTAMTLARWMAERNYGPEITERASAAGIHLTAAASAFSDAANALATLLNLRLSEVPESGRQAPHHAELSETGAQ